MSFRTMHSDDSQRCVPANVDTASPAGNFATLGDLLRRRSAERPQRRTFTFLVDGETQEVSLSNAELDERARAIASLLQEHHLRGERALLLYPPGLDLIAALFGCFYAGTVAVLPYPPDPRRLDRSLPRLQPIVEDSQAKALLSTTEMAGLDETAFAGAPRLGSLLRIATDRIELSRAAKWWDPGVQPKDLAFLQYTSGSTDQPKGVMLNHASLIVNLACQQSGWLVTADSHAAIWLPPYHDMGLIGGILLWLYAGATVTLMAPAAFLQRPARWLQAASRTKATHIGAPDFAYAMCVRRIAPSETEGLDLASLDVAWNGAETVRPETLQQFAEKFGGCGFRRRAFLPSYGLAEATLLVTAVDRARPAVPDRRSDSRSVGPVSGDAAGSPMGLIASCGPPVEGQRVVIVDPERRTLREPGEEGEIWVAGPSVAAGYWNRPQETIDVFHATLADGEGPFLRTGDLGYLYSGELFISSRLKDLIIIRGRNIHPLDVERTAEASHPALVPGAGAAFAVDVKGAERIVVVQEVSHSTAAPLDEVADAVRIAVAEAHEIQPYAVVLIKARTIHKTPSGKIQRRRTKNSFLAGTLSVRFELRDNALPGQDVAVRPAPVQDWSAAGRPIDRRRIEDWLVAEIASMHGVGVDEIDVNESFAANGLDSASSVALVGELTRLLGVALPETLLWDYPNIAALADHLAGMSPSFARQPSLGQG